MMLGEPIYTPFSAREVRPRGWLRRELLIQAKGLAGNLDLVWPDIRDSSWIGGARTDWERVPYWLDGFIPLAWLCEDAPLQARARKYVDGILARQADDGWLCPCAPDTRDGYDLWPAFLIGKVLVLYHDCTGDARIEGALYKALRQMLEHTARNTLFRWAATRWYECLIPIYWLYARRPEAWLLELAYTLEAQGTDFEKLYAHLDFERPAAARYWTQLNHVVNTAMALKSRALMSRLTGEDPTAFAHRMYEKVMRHHGMASGHFTGDECLSGDSATAGSECCGVAEAMYSYETLLQITGDAFWGDVLERVAYNAYPATVSPDMWSHQYDQQANQVECSRMPERENPFCSNGGESHLFGLEPNFGCCTANFGQAWPKLALSAVLKSAKGLCVGVLAPVEVCAEVEGVPVTLEVRTDYPFRDTAEVLVRAERPVAFELELRIPGFARSAAVDGAAARPGTFARVSRTWEGESVVRLTLDFAPEAVRRPGGLSAVNRGPLLFALPIVERWEKREYEKNGVARTFPYCDYEIFPESDWNYALCGDAFEVEEQPMPEAPFCVAAPPLRLRARAVHIPWEKQGSFCAAVPAEVRPLGEPETVFLQPYGCTNLRMTEMPLLNI